MTEPFIHILEATVELKSSAESFFDMLVGRPHHVTNATPSLIHGAELHEGELGQVGSVVGWKYFHDGEVKALKQATESMDPETNRVTYNVLEGDLLKEYKSFKIIFQVTPKEGETGSVAYWKFEYELINEEVGHPETLLQFKVDMSKEIDEHLQLGE
ncbi:unnamed protein product [Microthlaspi erraticum]|uniref:Bet v I/Major latex protein domain-containing protein n=1 Tax=Microthlaspi erraticum TaxID=1685480 RepID=A0A6D2I6W7_9BRAS|nr:unnamed protein product [Microthlaspi erraticum]